MPSVLPKTDPVSYFDVLSGTFEQARASAGAVEKFLRVGGLRIKLRFAGEKLLPLLARALVPLEVPPFSSADLTVCLWDSDSTRTPMPPPAWGAEDYRERGEIWNFTDERIVTFFHIGPNTLSMLDTQRNLALFWVRQAGQINTHVRSAPLLSLFNVWMRKHGIQLVHAGAVGTPKGAVLLAGKGGSGKSTTCLACLDSELFYLSDDYCLVQNDPEPTVFSLYGTGKQNPEDLPRFPFLSGAVSNPSELAGGKALYFLNEHFPGKLLKCSPLKAILLPRITNRPFPALQKASGKAALDALAASTVFQLPGAGEETLDAIAALVRKLPCFYLDLSADPNQAPAVILDFLSGSS